MRPNTSYSTDWGAHETFPSALYLAGGHAMIIHYGHNLRVLNQTPFVNSLLSRVFSFYFFFLSFLKSRRLCIPRCRTSTTIRIPRGEKKKKIQYLCHSSFNREHQAFLYSSIRGTWSIPQSQRGHNKSITVGIMSLSSCEQHLDPPSLSTKSRMRKNG